MSRTHVIVDEPNRLIEMREDDVPLMVDWLRLNEYHYYARRNHGDWVALKSLGNRIPADW